MRIAHVRERFGATGAPWRLAAALDGDRWLDLEVARRRLAAADSRLPHNERLFRQPITTLDAHLALGLRVEALRAIVDGLSAPDGAVRRDVDDDEDDAVLRSDDIAFGPPILAPPSLRDFYAFERHVQSMWARRGGDVPEAWYRLPVFYFGNTSEIRGPNVPVWAPKGCRELDFELEVAALVDTPARDLPADRAEEAIGGYTILDDWSARDLQRDETTVRLGPAKGKDFAISIGPWLVTPDELDDARHGKGFALTGAASVETPEQGRVEIGASSWADIHFRFGEMLERASADVGLRAGELIGSGTFGGGCLLEVGDSTLGRWLEPGDEVVLSVDRLGQLRTPIVQRSDRP
jgi:fumarylacetoacetate (FAA) hydrolase